MRRRSIGPGGLCWRELRALVGGLGLDSALYRSRNPRAWNWRVDTEFLAAILFTLQGANWQRGGGKGEKPRMVQRPREFKDPSDIAEVGTDVKKAALAAEIERRRALRDRRTNGRPRKQKMIDRVPKKTEG